MKKSMNYFILVIISAFLSSCTDEKPSNPASEPVLEEVKTSNAKSFEACAGVNEEVFRSMFNVPEDYKWVDASQYNVTKLTCVVVSENNGQQFNLMIQLLSTPATYSVMAAGVKRDFDNADPDQKIKGLGEVAVWVERENRKVSGISVVGKDHVVSIQIDHYNTRSREELQPMLEKFYKYWVKQQG